MVPCSSSVDVSVSAAGALHIHLPSLILYIGY
jgi:hypothetical protein